MSTRKACVRCQTSAATVTCEGCQDTFCSRHLAEHRRDIILDMNKLNNKCEDFRKTLVKENDPAPIFAAIDNWEKDSIRKIRLVAENTRIDVRNMTARTLNDFNKALDSITSNMETLRISNDATEIDLKTWDDELKSLQDVLQKPFPISLISEDSPSSSIRYIKAHYDPPLTESDHRDLTMKLNQTIKLQSRNGLLAEPSSNDKEQFHRIAGHVKLVENGSLATFVGYSSISGVKVYAVGTHRIRFRVVAKKNEGIFFGIMTMMQEMIARATELPSVYGWRDFNRAIFNGTAQLKAYKDKNIQPGDELTLSIDCNHSEISLTHHRLRRRVQISVDMSKCPLPWKLVVSSYGEDTICILT